MKQIAIIAAAALSLWAHEASASPSFPQAIQDELSMDCEPMCTICHRDNLGGGGTVDKAFGTAMRTQGGLVLGDDSSVAPALAELAEQGTDSDSDGTADVTELEQGMNPNGDDLPLCSGVTYGCGARVEPRGSLDGWWAALLGATVAVGLIFGRRRR